MEAFRDKDRIIMILDGETYKTFEYKGKKALAIEKPCKELEGLVSEAPLGSVQALSAPVAIKENKEGKREKAVPIAEKAGFRKDIATCTIAEVGNFLYKMRKDPRAQKAIEKRFGHVTMDFVIHCKGEKELKELAYALL